MKCWPEMHKFLDDCEESENEAVLIVAVKTYGEGYAFVVKSSTNQLKEIRLMLDNAEAGLRQNKDLVL